jgi:hypothetical protein
MADATPPRLASMNGVRQRRSLFDGSVASAGEQHGAASPGNTSRPFSSALTPFPWEKPFCPTVSYRPSATEIGPPAFSVCRGADVRFCRQAPETGPSQNHPRRSAAFSARMSASGTPPNLAG